MAAPSKEVSRERERVAWSLRQQGWTQQRIADQLGVSQPAVLMMLGRVESRLAVEFREQAEQIKARQTAILETVADEVLQQWRRSCEDGVTVARVEGRTHTTKDGDIMQLPDQVTTTIEGQSGNPGLIAQARGTFADIRGIWGLDAPQKREDNGTVYHKVYLDYPADDPPTP